MTKDASDLTRCAERFQCAWWENSSLLVKWAGEHGVPDGLWLQSAHYDPEDDDNSELVSVRLDIEAVERLRGVLEAWLEKAYEDEAEAAERAAGPEEYRLWLDEQEEFQAQQRASL
jgi:hypothetical protein